MNKAIITSVLIVLGVLGFIFFVDKNRDRSASNENDATIRTMVMEFGIRLQNVSLLAPEDQLNDSLENEYGPYLTAELLAEWQADPEQAIGRNTSSPWPHRIEVVEVIEENDGYRVEGNVIEVTNADSPNAPAAVYPVTLRVVEENDAWKVSDVKRGAYSEIPQRTSVVGTWTCLPHRETSGPQTEECAFGLRLDDGNHLAVNTMLMSVAPIEFQTNTRVRIEGVLTPIEQLSSNIWAKYDIVGIISATTITRTE